MQGTIAQILSITSYGNYFLSGNSDFQYFPENATFKFCKYVKFVDLERKGDKLIEKPNSSDPLEWFKNLRSEGLKQLRARYFSSDNKDISDRMSVAFIGGGGRWLIETVKANGSDFWEGKWEVGDQNDPDRYIWHVCYGRIAKNTSQDEGLLPPIEQLKTDLKGVLEQISSFAYKNNCENFGKCFDRGIKALSDESENEQSGYQINPPNYMPKSCE